MKRAFRTMRADLSELKESPAGRRFVRFHRCRQQHRQEGVLRRAGFVVLAVMLILVGAAIGILPIGVPGILLVVAGLAMLVVRSLTIARTLDRTERWLWRQWRRWRPRGVD